MISEKMKNSQNISSILCVEKDDETKFIREDILYKNCSHKYVLGDSKISTSQYNELYSARLANVYPILTEKAAKKWGDVPLKKLCDLNGDGSVCIIIGVLFKKQELKPSVLKELCKENQLMPQPVMQKFVSESDELILEDDLQRVHLKGCEGLIPELITGIVCAIRGYEEAGGKFVVEDICFAGVPESIEVSSPPENKSILFLSGLDLRQESSMLSLQLLVDYICGHLGQKSDQSLSSDIVKVVIAGNSICSSRQNLTVKEKVESIKIMDDILLQLASVCSVDVMPGEFDPSNHAMPQQPFHHCLFPESSMCKQLQCTTNPYEFELGGLRFLGTAGQNVNDVRQFTSIDDSVEILDRLSKWGHLAPSAPDTLLSYPYYGVDPFIIDSRPDIFFCGNQDCLSSRLMVEGESKPRLLLSVPSFSRTQTCALVDLKTLRVTPLNFGI